MPSDAPPPPTQKQAAKAQQVRHAAELAALALFAFDEDGSGSGEDEWSIIDAVKITAILVALSAGIVLASFHKRGSKSKTLLLSKPDHEQIAENVLPDAQKAFKELLSSELTDEQRAVLWATWIYSKTADEIAAAVDRGDIANEFTEQGLGLSKIWISRSDARVRSLHVKLHGRTVPVSEAFWRWPGTSQRLRWPGDEDAPADATIGCRCVSLLTWAKPSDVSGTIKKIVRHTAPR